jgi:hypothetical protein
VSWKKCSACGANFDGGMFEWTCPECRRQGQLVDVMQGLGEAQAQAAQISAAAAVHAAEAQHRIAAAAETEAAAKARQADLEGKAAYARAVGSIDDDGLRRLHADEQFKADREASQKVVDDVAAAVGCIEAGGAATPRIDSMACREAQAYPLENGNAVNGVGGAFRWHNLVACERLLVAARETLPKITHFAAAISREELEWKINDALLKVKPLRLEAAKSAVEDIGRNRALGYGIPLSILCIAFGIGYAVSDEGWMALIFPAVFCGFAVGIVATEWGKAKSPIHWEDIKREAGTGSRAGRFVWMVTGGLSVVGLLVGVLSMAFRIHTEKEKPHLTGDYTRGSQELRVEPGWLVLDGKQRLPLGSADVQGTTHAKFDHSLLSEGIIFDDYCSGSLDRNGKQLVVTMNEGSAAGCSAFAGEWIAKAAAPASATSAPGPAARWNGKWRLNNGNPEADVITISDRTLICLGAPCKLRTSPVMYGLKKLTPDPDVPDDIANVVLSRKEENGQETNCKGTLKRKNDQIFHIWIACEGEGKPNVDDDFWRPR